MTAIYHDYNSQTVSRPNRANPVILLRTAQNFFTANSLSQHSRAARWDVLTNQQITI